MSVPFAAQTRHSDTASQATDCDCQPASAGGCGCASITFPKPSDVERRLCEWRNLLRAQNENRRARLIHDLDHAQKAHKETSSIRKALAAATLGALR